MRDNEFSVKEMTKKNMQILLHLRTNTLISVIFLSRLRGNLSEQTAISAAKYIQTRSPWLFLFLCYR